MDLFSEEEIMQRANAQRQLMLDNEDNYDQLATAEKIAYGAAQETTLICLGTEKLYTTLLQTM